MALALSAICVAGICMVSMAGLSERTAAGPHIANPATDTGRISGGGSLRHPDGTRAEFPALGDGGTKQRCAVSPFHLFNVHGVNVLVGEGAAVEPGVKLGGGIAVEGLGGVGVVGNDGIRYGGHVNLLNQIGRLLGASNTAGAFSFSTSPNDEIQCSDHRYNVKGWDSLFTGRFFDADSKPQHLGEPVKGLDFHSPRPRFEVSDCNRVDVRQLPQHFAGTPIGGNCLADVIEKTHRGVA